MLHGWLSPNRVHREAVGKAQRMSPKTSDHWHQPETNQPEKEPGPYAQDKSRTPPTKERQEQYEKAGEAGEQTGRTFKK
jgi:hypothetical protein